MGQVPHRSEPDAGDDEIHQVGGGLGFLHRESQLASTLRISRV